MAAAASTPGIFCLPQQPFEQQRNKRPCQYYWHEPAQPRVSKRAAVDAHSVGDARRDARASTTPATSPAAGCANDDNSTLFFSALRVVLSGRGGERRLGSTLEMQCVCFEACKDCRELVPLRLRVSKGTPEHLWKRGAKARKADWGSSLTPSYGGGSSCSGDGESGACSEFRDGFDSGSGSDVGSAFSGSAFSGRDVDSEPGQPLAWGRQRPLPMERSGLGYSLSSHRDLPAPRIAGMIWERPTLEEVSFGSELAEITFGPAVIEPLHGVDWTTGLKRLTLSSNWNLPGATAVRGDRDGVDIDVNEDWPPFLEELCFGKDFNKPVDGIAFPASLLRLTLGGGFNHSVDLVAWPPALESISFGRSFNQRVGGVSWPSSLKKLSFGVSFDQSVAGVAWPASLRSLSFGYRFDQPIARVVWPAGLQQLSFGHDFNQPLAGVVWPASLKQLSFGFEFDQPVAGVALPTYLQKLTFGYCFNQPIASAAWPASLEQVTFGDLFDHPIDRAMWPASLRRLTLGFGFTRMVGKGMWPIGLSHLSVDRSYPLLRSDLPSGVRVELT